ncbi:MAG TPA: hypothetical protein VKO16_07960 [Polyangia bacterium]|nr:hypothetical protein [Polyangia bacterium]
MRSRFVVCAALAGIGLLGVWSPARAADPKAKSGEKSAKKKSADGLSDDKVISKQLQWEDTVMGPDDKRGELDKIARAQAINKAASEKAARDKEKAEAAAAKEPPAPPKAQTSKRGGEVALPSLPDEDSGKGSKGKTSEISPKLETSAAAAPPPPVKHGDDKFIDKLLKDEPSKKKKTSATDDKALNDLLATEKPAKPAAKGRGKRADDVDSLLDSADKAPPMPETKVKHETPEWAKPEIQSTPQPAPIAVRPQPKRDDGIIHVVQGAAPAGSRPAPAPAPARTTAGTRPAAFATRTPAPTLAPSARRQQTPASPASWNDPFADGPKKTVAARETRGSIDDDDDDVAPAPSRRRASAPPPPPVAKTEPSRAARGSARANDNDWSDPFKDSPKATTTRRAAPAAKPAEAPAHRGAWKDPFTEKTSAPSKSAHAAVAMREPRKGESTKWEADNKKSAPIADETPAAPSTHGRWGILKKRAH